MLEIHPSTPDVEVLAFPSPASRTRKGRSFHVEAVVVVEVTTPVEVTAVHDEDANRTAHSRSKSTTSLPTVLCETTIPEVKALPAVDLAADTPLKGTAEDASPIPHRLVSHRRVNSSPGASLGQPTSTLTETGGDRSPAQVTDKLFKLEARLGTLEAHSTLGSAAYDWVSMLVKGVQEHIASCEFDEDELRIDLHTALTGEIATRSRVPVQFELADQIIVKLVVGDEGAVALKVSGLYFGPVGGAMECWDRLREVWAEAGAMDDASKKEVAWRWWQHDGHKKDFEGTKLWRVIESLVGLRSATLIPTKDMQDVLMGCICMLAGLDAQSSRVTLKPQAHHAGDTQSKMPASKRLRIESDRVPLWQAQLAKSCGSSTSATSPPCRVAKVRATQHRRCWRRRGATPRISTLRAATTIAIASCGSR